MTSLENANPLVFQRSKERAILPEEEDDNVIDKIDSREVFDMIRGINDPEHPLTLEELNVLEESKVTVNDDDNSVHIFFTPTIPHCSMATLIGLAIRVKLLRVLPARFKVDVELTPGSHTSDVAINKQLADKERVAAALENAHLLNVVNQCLGGRAK
ncbi:cytosolic iron-sulfur assembly component 2B-like [Littorina saxatilis]|uniref:MIP18 family-like domain-containing protein n=1 Tax=Littorina saxatilis TaxID=31220 RepID=A0AAN9C1I1_9CAEN